MGFTPLDGLVMATRAGHLDPGALLWLARSVPLDEIDSTLWSASGLTALAGTPDMREVLTRAARGDRDALLARDVFVHGVRSGIGAMATSLGHLSGIVFTGGIGEASAEIRTRVCAGLGVLGVALDEDRNRTSGTDRVISRGSAVPVVVVAAREELVMAELAAAYLSAGGRTQVFSGSASPTGADAR